MCVRKLHVYMSSNCHCLRRYPPLGCNNQTTKKPAKSCAPRIVKIVLFRTFHFYVYIIYYTLTNYTILYNIYEKQPLLIDVRIIQIRMTFPTT